MTDRYSTSYGVYHITPKPGLPQVAICHGFYVLAGLKGKGHGHQLMSDMVGSLKLEHYDAALCTTSGGNAPMQKVLARAGWKLQFAFKNSKTGEEHQVWGIAL